MAWTFEQPLRVQLKPSRRVIQNTIASTAYLVVVSKCNSSCFTIYKVKDNVKPKPSKIVAFAEQEPDRVDEFKWNNVKKEFVQVIKGTRRKYKQEQRVYHYARREDFAGFIRQGFDETFQDPILIFSPNPK